jgi:hypothetical protein
MRPATCGNCLSLLEGSHRFSHLAFRERPLDQLLHPISVDVATAQDADDAFPG